MKVSNFKANLVFAFVVVSNIIYLIWRALFTIPYGDALWVIIASWILLLSEAVSFYTALVLFITRHKKVNVTLPSTVRAEYPHVDVLIATHNESVDLLRKTINGCKHLEYPDRSKVKIYLCDDNNREEVKNLAQVMGIHYLGVYRNKHAKSGNYNNALSKTSAPLIATFDADMIPHSDFLLKTVPYFISDEYDYNSILFSKEDKRKFNNIGFIQTPQNFYNPDLFHYNLHVETHIPNEQDFFTKEVNVANNSYNAAVYTGSNTLLSRQAILDAGGFPVNTITEDFQLGVQIQAEGYMCLATTEVLASGLTPTDIKSVIKQRVRWARGVIQSFYNLKILSNKKLSIYQKLIFTSNYFYWWSFFRRIVFILSPILFALFDVKIVDNNLLSLLIFWVPSYVSLNYYMGTYSGVIRTQRWGEVYETILAPFMILPVLFESIGIRENSFKVTSKMKNQGSSILMRLPHIILLILIILSFIRFNYGKYGVELIYGSIINFWLMHHAINLTLSVLFFNTRPIFRESERFIKDFDASLRISEFFSVSAKGYDLSEGGLSVTLNYLQWFPKDIPLTVFVHEKSTNIELKAKWLRTRRLSNGDYVYSFLVLEIDDFNKMEYLQLIYDQRNKKLAEVRDVWMSELDALVLGVRGILNIQDEKKNNTITSEVIDDAKLNFTDGRYLYIASSIVDKQTVLESIDKDAKVFIKDIEYSVFEREYQLEQISSETEVRSCL